MYQVEVKRTLIKRLFPPSRGWVVGIHLDPMEIAQGGTHPPGKIEAAKQCLDWFRDHRVSIEIDRDYGKADLVARHSKAGTFVVEVEGQSSKLRTQALYSALGQTLVRKYGDMPHAMYGLAVPDSSEWRRLLNRMPRRLFEELEIDLFLVSPEGVERLHGPVFRSGGPARGEKFT